MWTPSGPGIVEQRQTIKCEKCGYPSGDMPPHYYHADVCSYYIFRDTTAPERNMVSIEESLNEELTGPYITVILDSMGIEHVDFTIRGVVNSGWDIFVPRDVSTAIELYSAYMTRRDMDFAGMTLEDFIKKMCGREDDQTL